MDLGDTVQSIAVSEHRGCLLFLYRFPGLSAMLPGRQEVKHGLLPSDVTVSIFELLSVMQYLQTLSV